MIILGLLHYLFFELTCDVVPLIANVLCQTADASCAPTVATRFPLRSYDVPFSAEFNATAAPQKAGTTACDCDGYFRFDAAASLVVDIVSALGHLWRPLSAQAAAAEGAAAAAGTGAGERTVVDYCHPRGAAAPLSEVLAMVRSELKALFDAARELESRELMGYVPKVRLLTQLIPVYNAGDATPAALVTALAPLFLISASLPPAAEAARVLGELQRKAAYLLEAAMKRVAASAPLGAAPGEVAALLERCSSAAAAAAAGGASCATTLHTTALVVLCRYGSAAEQQAALQPRVEQALTAWDAATQGVLAQSPADVLGEGAEEQALTAAQAAAWPAVLGGVPGAAQPPVNDSAAHRARTNADRAMIELSVALRSLVVYTAPTATAPAAATSDTGDSMGDTAESAKEAAGSTNHGGDRLGTGLSALIGAPGGKGESFAPNIPAILTVALPTVVAALAWLLRAHTTAAAQERGPALAIIAAPSLAHAQWLLRWDAFHTVGSVDAAPTEAGRYVPLEVNGYVSHII